MAQPDPQIAVMTLISRVLGWLLLAAFVFATLVPIELRPVSTAPVSVKRFGAFALLGFLFALGYPRGRWQVLCVVILAAGGLEALQVFEATRHGRLTDFLVKGSGGLFGAAMALCLAFVPTLAGKAYGSAKAGR